MKLNKNLFDLTEDQEKTSTNNGVYIEKRENEIIGASIVDDLVDIARRK